MKGVARITKRVRNVGTREVDGTRDEVDESPSEERRGMRGDECEGSVECGERGVQRQREWVHGVRDESEEEWGKTDKEEG